MDTLFRLVMRSKVRYLEQLFRVREVGGSNPPAPTTFNQMPHGFMDMRAVRPAVNNPLEIQPTTSITSQYC